MMAAGRGYGVRMEDLVSMANWERRCFDRALAFKSISLEWKAAVDRAEVVGARKAVARSRQEDRRSMVEGRGSKADQVDCEPLFLTDNDFQKMFGLRRKSDHIAPSKNCNSFRATMVRS